MCVTNGRFLFTLAAADVERRTVKRDVPLGRQASQECLLADQVSVFHRTARTSFGAKGPLNEAICDLEARFGLNHFSVAGRWVYDPV